MVPMFIAMKIREEIILHGLEKLRCSSFLFPLRTFVENFYKDLVLCRSFDMKLPEQRV